MKTENLEALLIDRALGELPTATAELLDEYVTSNPEAAGKAKELQGTLALAREAIPVVRTARLRAFPRTLIERESRRADRGRQTYQLLKLAACLAVGLALGWFGKSRPGEVVVAKVPVAVPIQQVASIDHKPLAKQTAGFWSLARLETRLRERESVDKTIPHRIQLLSPRMTRETEKKL